MNTKQCKPLSKVDQLKRHAPLKQKAVKDKEYLAWFHNQGFCCLVCNNPQIEAHHIKEHSNDKKDDRVVIPLCGEEHHRNGKLSPHGGTKLWRETYSMDEQIAYANKLRREYEDKNN